jgi:Mn-dependent DtxR family transcriptional regulator
MTKDEARLLKRLTPLQREALMTARSGAHYFPSGPGTVTQATCRTLQRLGLARLRGYRTIELTAEGERMADLVRRHGVRTK